MVIKKENLKETEITLTFDLKTVESDINSILHDINIIKQKPFQDIYIFIPKDFPKDYIFKLLNNLKYKNFLEKEKQILIKI